LGLSVSGKAGGWRTNDIKEGLLLAHSHWFPRRREGRSENLNQAIVSKLRIVENTVGKNAQERSGQLLALKSADIDEGLGRVYNAIEHAASVINASCKWQLRVIRD
jgi:hypothetical protein